eukprot:Pompholyxophrys_sp_v1_NODE_472_length_534_cov_2.100209.p3 type:complete len:130 gc:universal NODE_472_length_534_cov_2.100209:145-534(+)
MRIRVSVHKHLEGADLGGQPVRELDLGAAALVVGVVEGRACEGHDLRVGHDVEAQEAVHHRRARLGDVAQVGDQATAPEAAGTARAMGPLGPLGVQVSVRLFVLGLEDADDAVREEVRQQFRLQFERMM